MVTLTITVNDDGTVSVSGPIDNKLLALGMLAVAHDAIYDHDKSNQARVQLAPGPLSALKID